ncbi:(Fe-S)-binding protein [archaeon]|jgi:Fe-S oxidoreductase|nr:(Fe-S)-binding protein [archaeon]MBT4241380.1 (Fe-S)-binding protein [archaeon]MBT4418201.1 (Fe-S)-binding protein [archaeon]
MSIESDNAKENVKDIVDKCIKCGMCNSLCPVLKIVREEQSSPRGKAILLDSNYFEKLIYECSLCKACESKCPLNLKLCEAFVNARKVLVLSKKECVEGKEMIKNLNKSGNIYGEIESD